MKIATKEDLSEVMRMAMNFLEVSGYKEYSDEASIEKLFGGIITSAPTEGICILSPNQGFIIGACTPFLFGQCLLATEVAWWVEPEARGSGEGLKLLNAFEYWAKNVAGCRLISMTSLNKDVEKVYKKNGYKLYERAYMKVL